MCGEHTVTADGLKYLAGSSPRVRGTRQAAAQAAAAIRFIPACAGNTHCGHFLPRTMAVHPRVCGEHALWAFLAEDHGGSSPRVRGTLLRQKPRPRLFRFIPACAGNTLSKYLSLHFVTVHPRVCGEHHHLGDRTDQEVGSSPRVRGTRWTHAMHDRSDRFIPACAGNTS